MKYEWTDEASKLYNEANDKVKKIVDVYLSLSDEEREWADNLLHSRLNANK